MNSPSARQTESAEALIGQLTDEFLDRLNRGENPEIEEYAHRHPELAAVIRQVFPALEVLRLAPSASALALDQPPAEGSAAGCLGDYRIMREIGRGGMGVVYEAEQISLGRRVALKVLPFAAALDARHLQRFKNEAHAAAQLHHTNIVPVFGIGCDRGVHYYAMQYIDGQTLATLIGQMQRLGGTNAADRPKGSLGMAALRAEQSQLWRQGQRLTVEACLERHAALRHSPEAVLDLVYNEVLLREQQGETAQLDDYLSRFPLLASQLRKQFEVHDVLQASRLFSAPTVDCDGALSRAQLSAIETTARMTAVESTESSTKDPAFFRTAAELGVQAAEALEHAHQSGVIHRDIKPANLLVDVRGKLWITDFGLAHCQSQAGLTMTGDLLGTLRYMSPEQALAQRVAIDQRTDIYSLGATLYELLTLEPAFNGRNRQELLRQIAFEEPKPPRRLVKAVPAELETIVLKAMEKNPAERYATAREVADDLARFLEDEPIRARRPTLAHRAYKWTRRHRAVVRVAVVMGLLAVAALAAATWLLWYEKEQTGKALASLQGEQQKTEEALRQEQQATYFLRIVLADREWLANNVAKAEQLLAACPPESRGWEWRYLHRLCQGAFQTFRRHAGDVHSVAFSPDGRRLASADGEPGQPGEIKICDAATGQELLSLKGHNAYVNCVVFSPNGQRLASGSQEDQTLRVWDANSGQEVLSLHTGRVFGVAFGPDGKRLATAEDQGEARIWDVETGRLVVNCQVFHGASVTCVAFSPDGKYLAAAGNDTEVKVLDTATGKVARCLVGTGAISCLAYSPDGQRLATGGWGARVWDMTTGETLYSFHSQRGLLLALSSDGQRLASADSEGLVKIWDGKTGEELFALRGVRGGVRCLAFGSAGQRLAAACADRAIRVWDLTADRECLALPTYGAPIFSVAFGPNSKLLGVGLGGETVVWDTVARRVSLDFRHAGVCVRFSSDGKLLAAASSDKTVKVWDAASGEELLVFRGHKGYVQGLAFSPDGVSLASASWDGTIKVWVARTGRELLSLDGHRGGRITAVAFSPDGKWLASASGRGNRWLYDSNQQRGQIKLWDATTGKELFVLGGHTDGVQDVAFSPDGKHLASASWDHTIRFWDVTTGQESLVLRGHTNGVEQVVFSPDGQRLASASWDKTVKLWQTWGGQETYTIRGHTSGVLSVAFSADGQRLASADFSGAVKIWDAGPSDRTGE